jgi:Peptidase A4 family
VRIHPRLVIAAVATSVFAGGLLLPTAAGAAPNRATGARAALSTVHIGPALVASQHAGTASTAVQSPNWSGFGDGQPSTGSTTYTQVSGTWLQPTLKCTSEDRVVVFWVGLDGLTSSTVEQAGTLAQCFQGSAFYYTWWEMYPTTSIKIVGTTVAGGDSIAASVSFASGTYTLAVTDSTTSGNSFSVKKTCGSGQTCLNSSAEWIAERPSNPYGLYPLAQFTLWTLTHATVKGNSTTGTINSFPNFRITMVDVTDTYALATPSAFTASTKSFTDKWSNSY